MAIGRTEFQFSVAGADATERAFRGVADAEEDFANAGQRAAAVSAAHERAMLNAAAAADRYRRLMASATTDSATGIRSVSQATIDAARADAELAAKQVVVAREMEMSRRSVDAYQASLREATKAQSGFAKVADIGGKALSGLYRAAAILPGFGIAGLLLAIAEGGKAVYEAMTGVSSATADATREMQYQAALAREHTAYMEKQAAAARDLAQSMTEVGQSFLAAQSGISGGMGGSAYLLGSVFGEDLEMIKAEKKELQQRAGALKKARDDLMRDFSNAAVEYEGTRAAPAIRAALDARLKAIETEANIIRQYGNNIRDREVDLMRAAKSVMGDAREQGKKAGGKPVDMSLGAVVGRIAAEPSPRRDMTASALAGLAAMEAESYDFSAEDARARAQELADLQTAQDQRNAMMLAHMQAAQTEAITLGSAFDSLANSFSGTFDRMVSTATDMGGLLTSVFQGISGAVGKSMTNLILTGEGSSKELKKTIGNALAGISAQAFGYATLLAAFGAAAAIPGVGMILGMNAPGFFAAAGIMAGAGLLLAGSARALGADKLGGSSGSAGRSSGSGGSSSGGGGSSAAVGTGGGPGGGPAPIYVSVQIGEEPVAAIMRRSNERESRRGGMGGHFAMGAA